MCGPAAVCWNEFSVNVRIVSGKWCSQPAPVFKRKKDNAGAQPEIPFLTYAYAMHDDMLPVATVHSPMDLFGILSIKSI